MKPHPVATLFPPMSEGEFDALVEDIREQGLHDPIVTYSGFIVDGVHRWRACLAADVEPRTIELELAPDQSLVAWAIGKNRHRRHLTPAQLATIAADASALFEEEARQRRNRGLKQGNDSKNRVSSESARSRQLAVTGNTSAKTAAESVGASQRSTERAARIMKADPELHRKVRDGAVTLNAAEQELKRRQATATNPRVDDRPRDGVGVVIENDRLAAAIREAETFSRLIREAQRLRRECVALADLESGAGAHLDTATLEGGFQSVIDALKWGTPYALCPHCGGKDIDDVNRGCKACKREGFVTRVVYDRAPAELKRRGRETVEPKPCDSESFSAESLQTLESEKS